jgi:hypothetical protein
MRKHPAVEEKINLPPLSLDAAKPPDLSAYSLATPLNGQLNFKVDYRTLFRAKDIVATKPNVSEMKIPQTNSMDEIRESLRESTKLFSSFFEDENKIYSPPKSPKPARKILHDTVSASDTKPRSTSVSITDDPLNQDLWINIFSFFDIQTIALLMQTGRLLHSIPYFEIPEIEPLVDSKKRQHFLRSLPKPNIIYYSRASLMGNRREWMERVNLPDIHNDSGDAKGFTMPGRKA